MYCLAILIIKKINCKNSGWFSNNIYMVNNTFYSITILIHVYGIT